MPYSVKLPPGSPAALPRKNPYTGSPIPPEPVTAVTTVTDSGRVTLPRVEPTDELQAISSIPEKAGTPGTSGDTLSPLPVQPPLAIPATTEPAGAVGGWPASLPGVGTRTLGPFTRCLWCGAGTWVRYGPAATCLRCARKVLGAQSLDDARTFLHGLLSMWSELDEATWGAAEVGALKDYIVSFWTAYPDLAEAWFREWRKAHPAARLC